MQNDERTYLRYRRSVIELWPESPRKQKYLEALAWREQQLDSEDAHRCFAIAQSRIV
jgi:hypothetical protein